MAKGRDRQLWEHTSGMLAMIANVNRDPKKTRLFQPADFNPYRSRRRRGIPLTADNIRILKGLVKR